MTSPASLRGRDGDARTSLPLDVEDDGSPRAVLGIVGHGARACNHRTSQRFNPHWAGGQFPSSVDRSLGELTYLTGMFPQVFGHMIGALRAQLEQGHIEIDAGSIYTGNPEAAGIALEHARQAAQRLYRGTADAQSAISAASYSRPEAAGAVTWSAPRR